MNIAFIYAYGIHPTLGGVANVTYGLCQLFRKYGHNVWFIGLSDSKYIPNRDNCQVFLPNKEVICTENICFLSDLIYRYKITIIINQTASSDVKTIYLLEECRKNLIDRFHFNIVTCFHTSILTSVINYAYTKELELKENHLGLVFSLLKTKVISKLIELLYIRNKRKSYRVFFDKSDLLIVLCEGQKRELIKMLGVENELKIVVIPNSAPLDDNINSKEKSNIVLWLGQFSNNIKRPDWMLDIWKKVNYKNPSWKLYMLGDGEAFESIKEKVKKNEIKNVILTGRVEPQEYYEKAKLLCVTSVHEAFPMVLMEAQQNMVVPIVYNSFTSASSIIKTGVNGYLIHPFDEDEFASKLDYLMNNEAEIVQMRNAGKLMARCYSKDNVYKLWEQELGLLNN